MSQGNPAAADGGVASPPAGGSPSGSFSRLYMTISTLTRMGVGLVVLVFLARLMGPERYGLFATVMAYGYLASLLTDFGLPVKTLRDIAAWPAEAPVRMARTVTIKLILTAVIAIIGAATLILLPLDAAAKISSLMIVLAVLVGSTADLVMVGLRAVGRFGDETRVVLWTSALHVVGVGAVAYLYPDPIHVGAAFLISRTIYLAAAWLVVRRQFGRSLVEPMPISALVGEIRHSGWWAADSGLSYLVSQIDGPILAQALGLSAAGIYQGGNRFVQAGLAVAGVLANVHIPRLAAKAKAPDAGDWRIFAEFAGLGAIGGVALLVVGPLITRYVLGAAYGEVDRLWPGFAAFVFVRYVGAALGVSLSARAKPAIRVGAQVCGLAALAIGFGVALPRYGVAAAPWVMTLGSSVIAIIYASAFVRQHRKPG